MANSTTLLLVLGLSVAYGKSVKAYLFILYINYKNFGHLKCSPKNFEHRDFGKFLEKALT